MPLFLSSPVRRSMSNAPKRNERTDDGNSCIVAVLPPESDWAAAHISYQPTRRQIKNPIKDFHIKEFAGEEYLKEGRLPVH